MTAAGAGVLKGHPLPVGVSARQGDTAMDTRRISKDIRRLFHTELPDGAGLLLALVAAICVIAVVTGPAMLEQARQAAAEDEAPVQAQVEETRRLDQMDQDEIRAERRRGLVMLRTNDLDLRISGLRLLGTFGDRSVEGELLDVLKTQDNPQLWRNAEIALARIWSRSGDPKVDELMRTASELQQARSPDRVLHVLTAAIDKAPDFGHVYIRRAGCYLGLGEYDLAIHDAERAAGLNPNDFTALLTLANAYVLAGRLPEAERSILRAMAVNPHLKQPSGMLKAIRKRLGAADRSVSTSEEVQP